MRRLVDVVVDVVDVGDADVGVGGGAAGDRVRMRMRTVGGCPGCEICLGVRMEKRAESSPIYMFPHGK